MPKRISRHRYPFIHFKDEVSLKFIALYWDKTGCIVPGEYGVIRDSGTVKQLADELGFIENFEPGGGCQFDWVASA